MRKCPLPRDALDAHQELLLADGVPLLAAPDDAYEVVLAIVLQDVVGFWRLSTPVGKDQLVSALEAMVSQSVEVEDAAVAGRRDAGRATKRR